MNGRLEIFLDPSGKTYAYQLYNEDEEFLYGDGYETIEEIKKDLFMERDLLNIALENIILK